MNEGPPGVGLKGTDGNTSPREERSLLRHRTLPGTRAQEVLGRPPLPGRNLLWPGVGVRGPAWVDALCSERWGTGPWKQDGVSCRAHSPGVLPSVPRRKPRITSNWCGRLRRGARSRESVLCSVARASLCCQKPPALRFHDRTAEAHGPSLPAPAASSILVAPYLHTQSAKSTI